MLGYSFPYTCQNSGFNTTKAPPLGPTLLKGFETCFPYDSVLPDENWFQYLRFCLFYTA